MYKISDYFRQLIDDEGGTQKFADNHGLSREAIEGYYNGTRKIQETTLISLAIELELWKKLVK